MKALLFFFLSIFYCLTSHAQSDLLLKLSKAKEDTTKVWLLNELAGRWYFENPDSVIKYARMGLSLADSLKFRKGSFFHKLSMGHAAWESGDYPTAIKIAYSLRGEKIIFSDPDYLIFNSYRDMGEPREALKWVDTVKWKDAITFAGIASCYYELGKLDSSLLYLKRSMSFPEGQKSFQGWINMISARVYEKLHKPTEAKSYYHSAIQLLKESENFKDLSGVLTSLGMFHLNAGEVDSAIYFGEQARVLAAQHNYQKEEYDSYLLLARAFENKENATEALKFFKAAIDAKEKVYGKEKQKQIEGFKFTEELRKKEELETEEKFKSQLRIYALSGALIMFALFMVLLYRNNLQKQKANSVLQKTLGDLKATQSQLIQSEKMASLGELTAGIAHEIQNPLNFVNNISEVNTELIDELKQELAVGNKQSAEELVNDIKSNSEKINHHGKRAGDIVKGMLQHSRTSSGVKESTDINALADEYLRLAYHGLRAKDKSFNASMKTDFDETIGNINVVPQDIGRVILNLITNAFYVVNEKATLRQAQGDSYEPTVSVSTKKDGNKVLISVKDNGNGIPQKILDKIFQPFFTTKPTGQGTGLGLSLSYDIVKAHGGELKVETKESAGSEFVMSLPV